ncbi:aminotransferase class I/II-fold pyridoxal phosphate-dependent enzyme, partial [Limosilactobacillus mucosae]
DKGIATNSLSKTYSVPGIRIGWTATNAALAERFRKYRDYTMICGGVFNDLLATYVLRHKKQVLARNRKLVLGNLKIYQDWIEHEERASVVIPQAVSTSFPKLDVPVDIHQFCEQLLADQGVLLVPGDAFDTPGHVRLGYCAPQVALKEGLKRLSIALHQYD